MRVLQEQLELIRSSAQLHKDSFGRRTPANEPIVGHPQPGCLLDLADKGVLVESSAPVELREVSHVILGHFQLVSLLLGIAALQKPLQDRGHSARSWRTAETGSV